MDQPLTSQQLLHNSYHLSIRSSLLAIQCILSRQETILQSNHYTVTDIKSTVTSQNTTLQNITKTLAETFSKISSYKSPSLPQTRSAAPATTVPGLPPIAPATATAVTTISTTAPPTSTAAAPHITSPIPNPMSTLSFSLQTHPQPQTQQQLMSINLQTHSAPPQQPSRSSSPASLGLLTSHRHEVRSSAAVYEKIVYDDGAQKLFDEMVEKKTIKPVEGGELLDKFYRLFESRDDKFELVSRNFLMIGSAKAVSVNEAWYVFSETPLRNKITCSMFIVYIFDPGIMVDVISISDLEDKVVFEGKVLIRIAHF